MREPRHPLSTLYEHHRALAATFQSHYHNGGGKAEPFIQPPKDGRRKKQFALSLYVFVTIWSFLSKSTKITALIGDGNDAGAAAHRSMVQFGRLSFLWRWAKIIPIPPPWSIHIPGASEGEPSCYSRHSAHIRPEAFRIAG